MRLSTISRRSSTGRSRASRYSTPSSTSASSATRSRRRSGTSPSLPTRSARSARPVALRDVRYRFSAVICPRETFRGTLAQLNEQALRRIRSGKTYYQPSLGLRQFVGYFEESDKRRAPICEDMDAGWMVYDIFDLHDPEVRKKTQPRLSLYPRGDEAGRYRSAALRQPGRVEGGCPMLNALYQYAVERQLALPVGFVAKTVKAFLCLGRRRPLSGAGALGRPPLCRAGHRQPCQRHQPLQPAGGKGRHRRARSAGRQERLFPESPRRRRGARFPRWARA